MAQKNKNRKELSKKIDRVESTFDSSWKHIFVVVFVVLIILGIFYLLTVYITNKDEDTTAQDTTDNSSVIQYEEIMAGSSFSISEKDYLVLYYDKSNEELTTDIEEAMSNYKRENDVKIYTVDLSNALNKSVIATESNSNPTKASELSLSGETLISFSQNTVVDYIEGKEAILQYLES